MEVNIMSWNTRSPRFRASWLSILFLVVFMMFIIASCGNIFDNDDDGGGSWCPGKICNNCAASGDCNIDCPAGQQETCVGGAFFDADSNLRCAYCE